MKNKTNLKKQKVILLFVLCIIIIVSSAGCSKKMSDEDFVKITYEVGLTVIKPAWDLQSGSITQREFDRQTDPQLKRCCKKYGYSIGAYKRKANKWEKQQKRQNKKALRNF